MIMPVQDDVEHSRPQPSQHAAVEPIAIVGMAMRLPGRVHNAEGFWDMLVNKRSGLCRVPQDRYNIDGFYSAVQKPGTLQTTTGYYLEDINLQHLDTSFFSISKKELERLDPQQRQLLEVAWECMENAGATNWRGKNIGCYVGVFGEDWLDLNAKDTQHTGGYRVTGYGDFVLGNRISYEYNLQGPSMTVKTGCSSSLICLHLACEAIRSGDCTSAIVGGTGLITSPTMALALTDQGVLSPSGMCKSFDASADGYGRGEAINAIYIKKLNDALRDGDSIRAVIRSSATNCDGKTAGMLNPSSEAQESLIRHAYSIASISDYGQTAIVECHGTGTPVGDPLETAAVANVFGEKGVLITSVKPNVGHSEGAAGITSVIKAVLALENQLVPPNIHFEHPNPNIPFKEAKLRVPTEVEPWPKDRFERMSINSFGIGGANAHVVLESSREHRATTSILENTKIIHPGQFHLLVFSATSSTSLQASLENYQEHMRKQSPSLLDLSYTLVARREHLPYRAYAIANSTSSLEASAVQMTASVPRVIYVFTGQGAQWPEMGRALLDHNLVFRDTIRKLDRFLRTLSVAIPWTIEDELRKPASTSQVQKAEFSQPLCTAVQIALVDVLRTWGVKPDGVVGHSSGEIAGAYASGSITAEAAMATASFRGLTTKHSAKLGAMAAVGLGREEASGYLKPGVVIACENSQSSITISGDAQQIQEVVGRIKNERPGILARMLHVEKAYHSHHMKEFGESYQKHLESVVRSVPPKIPFYSSVTGRRLSDAEKLGPLYWRQNLENPVLFNSAIRAIQQEEASTVFIELGPHPALKGPLKQILREVGRPGDVHVGSLSRGEDCESSLLHLAGNLFLHKVTFNYQIIAPPGALLTNLPNYSWVHDTAHWNEPRLAHDWRFRDQPPHDLLGARVIEGSNEPRWRNMLSIENVPWLADHKIADQILFCAAGYIAMVGEALRQISGIEFYSLKHISISSALVLEHEKAVEVSTSLSPVHLTSSLDSPWFEFQISSYNGSTWTKHFSGEARSSIDNSRNKSESCLTLPLPRKVSTYGWYKTMKRVGLDYGPVFQGMDLISAATDKQVAVATVSNVEIPGGSLYAIHPATIDQCFQILTVAAFQGQGRKFQQLAVPTYIEELDISPVGTQSMRIEAVSALSGKGAFTGDVSMQGINGTVLHMKGFRSSILENGDSAIDDVRLITQIEWKTDSDFCELGNFMEPCITPRKEWPLLEELFLLCIMEHQDQVMISETTPDHLRKFFGWMQTLVKSARSGTYNVLPETQALCKLNSFERLARIKVISAEVEETDFAVAAIAIRRLFDDSASIYKGETKPLDVLMKDNILTDLYTAVDSGNYSEAFKVLAHKKPQLRILEVGAGTGGTTAKILRALRSAFGERMYAKYMYTDISSGFMAAAKERFENCENIEYGVLDISQDPVEQGFQLGAYDLIIGSNVVHATPCLQDSLKNLRALLHPDGHLFLQELCPDMKWINYIMGFLPGWWLGEDDDRSNEPYVLPDRWSQELLSAGFKSPDAIVYDDAKPYHLSANIFASPATQDVVPNRVTLLCCSESEPILHEIKMCIEDCGIAVDICLFGQVPPKSQEIISLVDFQDPILHGISGVNFTSLKNYLLGLDAAMIWVTQASQVNCEDPRAAMILGMARSARNELLLDFFTVEVDSSTTISDVAKGVIKIFLRIHRREKYDETMDLDWEYAIVDGEIKVPRLHWETMAESLTQRQDSGRKTVKRVAVGNTGLLDTMHWTEELSEDVKANDVIVAVKAVGLNFRDVLITIGVMDDSTTELGLEGSGVVQAVGPAVKHLTVGDHVMFMTSGCFTTEKTLSEVECIKIDSLIGFEEAATLPCVYGTVILALLERGNLRKGQTLLIHSACGGIGLAAIQIAKMVGAKIYCTVGNEEKAQYLVENHSIPRAHISSSRDLSFFTDIMRLTDNKGVDIVLNSLSGELLHASWQCVAEFGAMIEIGKRDLRGRGRLIMDLFEANRTFYGVDLWQISRKKPEKARALMQKCITYLHAGAVKPIAIANVFEASNIQDAFRFMQKGQHIGKIVVRMPSEPKEIQSASALMKPSIRANVSYLIVGGLGGLGRAVSTWMVENGARHLIYLSRSAKETLSTQDFLNELRTQGCHIQLISGSVSNLADVEAAVEAAISPIAGVINMSMILKDVSIAEMTFEEWMAVVEPKVKGTWNLHHAISSKLDFFILFASYSGIAGQWGQANYGAANTFLDAFVQYRHHSGLAASVIDVGIMGDVGYVSQNADILEHFRMSGMHLLEERDLLNAMTLAMNRSLPCLAGNSGTDYTNPSQIVLGFRTTKRISDPNNRVAWKRDPRMGFYHNLDSSVAAATATSSSNNDLKGLLASAASQPEILIQDDSIEVIGASIGSTLFNLILRPQEEVNLDQSLKSLGVDSLVSMELRNWIRQQLGVEIRVLDIVQSSSLLRLGKLTGDALLAKYKIAAAA